MTRYGDIWNFPFCSPLVSWGPMAFFEVGPPVDPAVFSLGITVALSTFHHASLFAYKQPLHFLEVCFVSVLT